MNYNCNLECFLEIEKMIWFCIFPCLVFNCRSHWFYLFVPSLSSVQLSHSVMSDPLWPHGSCSKPGLPVPHQLLEFIQTQVHWVGDAIQPSHPCCLPLLPPSIFPSFRLFSNESALCIRWPKYWSFSFNISPSNGYSGLICLRMDWLNLLVVQETLKSLLKHHSSKASILRHSAFFIVQLSHLYMTTGKTIALSRQTLVRKVMSLLFNMLTSWMQSSKE